MKKKSVMIALLALAGIATASAKNIVEITTSCGKTAWIDTERGTWEEVLEQIMKIDEVLCADDTDHGEEAENPEQP